MQLILYSQALKSFSKTWWEDDFFKEITAHMQFKA